MMVSILNAVGSLLPYHLLSYGTLLGTQVFQSFVNTKLCFRWLPMKEFLILQKHIFPAYFRCQIGLGLLTAATYPPYGLLSIMKDASSFVPLGIVVATGALNYFVFGPKAVSTAFLRSSVKHTKRDEPDRVERANRLFARYHAMSIHINAISLVATVWYGFSLASKMADGF